MSEEREFRNQLHELTNQNFLYQYLDLKEADWANMSRGITQAWEDELIFRGLSGRALEATGELTTPGKRYLNMHYQRTLMNDPRSRQYKGLEATDQLDSASRTEEATGSISQTTPTPSQLSSTSESGSPSLTDSSLPSATTDSPGGFLPGREVVPGVGPGQPIAPPSSEASSGAPIGAEGGYEMVAYTRLPLAGKRDAFLAEGFLYVRQKTLTEWLRRLQDGKCCPLARKGQPGHSSDCWIGNAVR